MPFVCPQQGIHGSIAVELQLANPYRHNSAACLKFPHRDVFFLVDLFAFFVFDGLIGDGSFMYVLVGGLL